MARVVFSSSDIVTSIESQRGGRQIATYVVRGIEHRAWTKGRLEIALASGFEVYVYSRRTAQFKHDQWYIDQIGEDHVFFHDPKGALDNEAHSLLKFLGIEWPTNKEIGRVHLPKEPARWSHVRYWLPSQGIDNILSFSG